MLIPSRFVAVLLYLVVACVMLACSEGGGTPAFNSADISGARYAKDFELTDASGARRSLADYRGQLVTVFFGFTQCPDACPTALLLMREVMEKLGPDAEQVQVLFITLDPERDTPEVLEYYVTAFDSRFVGLYGSLDETVEVAKEFRVYYAKAGDLSGMNYTIDHSTGTYVFDREGKIRLHARHTETAENLAQDLKRLLAE